MSTALMGSRKRPRRSFVDRNEISRILFYCTEVYPDGDIFDFPTNAAIHVFPPALNAHALSTVCNTKIWRLTVFPFRGVYNIMQLVIEIYIIIVRVYTTIWAQCFSRRTTGWLESWNPGDGGGGVGQMYARCTQYTSAGRKKNNGADLWAVVWHITCTRGRFSREGIRIRLCTPGGEEEISDDTMREGRLDGDEGKYAH